jgi:hypothetical protein
MTTYRAFLLDKQGKAVDAKILDCKNDDDAMETAKQYVNGFSVQLWKERRLIAHLKESDSAPEAYCSRRRALAPSGMESRDQIRQAAGFESSSPVTCPLMGSSARRSFFSDKQELQTSRHVAQISGSRVECPNPF